MPPTGERALNSRLASFLLGWDLPLDLRYASARMFGAFAYTALPSDHPARPGFRVDYLKGVARHLSIKAEVAPLIAAWRAEGIVALLWKGFYLAEFIYPTPGTRFHGDVDVLLHPRDLGRAARIAADMSWTGGRDPTDRPDSFRHCAYWVVRPGGPTLLEVHRYVLHRHAPWTIRQGRLTRAVWDQSIETDWEDTKVRLPHPVDAALVCLLLHRAWGLERWGFKPHDLLDLRYLIERKGVSRAALESRGSELGCRRTLALMLERCDPWTGRFEPGTPPPARAWRFDVRTLHEHAPFRFEQWGGMVLRGPRVLYETLRALPTVLYVRRAARRESDLNRLMSDLTPTLPPHRSSARRRAPLVRGVRLATWLARDPRIGAFLIRSLAIYRALLHRCARQASLLSTVERHAIEIPVAGAVARDKPTCTSRR